MKNEDFRELIKQHTWYVYTDGKIGKEWKLPKNYPIQQIEGFTIRQVWILGVIVGQLWARKEDDNFTKIYGVNDINMKISKLIIAAVAEIPWDSVKWEPNEETKQSEKLFEDLHINEEVNDER